MALSTTLDPARLQRAVAVAEDAVRNGPYPSALLAVANAETTLLNHTVSHPERAPVREDGIFLLASITKPIVATAIMRLVEEGRLLLSDPVVKYIPEFDQFGKQAVTIWHILTHTSGLEEAHWWEQLYQQRAPVEAFLPAVCQSPLHFEPGTRYEYCSLSFVVLGELIARLGGLPYPEYLQQHIFAPLGMRDTSFAPSGAQQERAIHVYGLGEEAVEPSARRFLDHFVTVAAPGGGLWSTAADLVRFGQAFLRGGRWGGYQLLSPAAIELMTRLHTGGLVEILEYKPVPASYGLGWGKPGAGGQTLASPRAYEHGGATGTRLHIDPEWDLVFVFLTNCWGIQGDASQRALNVVYGALRRG
ncbi:MAG TPA: serine hydrolase domain-containing protein [Roseiflexaceae bacterium]|nr:serine hydrolase domain-containing protein [Roseiflexaceae bacterium]